MLAGPSPAASAAALLLQSAPHQALIEHESARTLQKTSFSDIACLSTNRVLVATSG